MKIISLPHFANEWQNSVRKIEMMYVEAGFSCVAVALATLSFLSQKGRDRFGVAGASIDMTHRLFMFGMLAFFVYMFIFDVFVGKYNELRIYVLNMIFLVYILLFSIYKMCPLTVLLNRVVGLPECTPFRYVGVEEFVPNPGHKCYGNTWRWLDHNVYKTFAVLVLNILFFVHKFI